MMAQAAYGALPHFRSAYITKLNRRSCGCVPARWRAFYKQVRFARVQPCAVQPEFGHIVFSRGVPTFAPGIPV